MVPLVLLARILRSVLLLQLPFVGSVIFLNSTQIAVRVVQHTQNWRYNKAIK